MLRPRNLLERTLCIMFDAYNFNNGQELIVVPLEPIMIFRYPNVNANHNHVGPTILQYRLSVAEMNGVSFTKSEG